MSMSSALHVTATAAFLFCIMSWGIRLKLESDQWSRMDGPSKRLLQVRRVSHWLTVILAIAILLFVVTPGEITWDQELQSELHFRF